ncbi:MAG: RluA family pseudouridine synthase [Thermodesulfovibrionia bacterium]
MTSTIGISSHTKLILSPSMHDEGQRLDVFISKETGLSRSYAQRLIREGRVSVNSLHGRPSYKVKSGDTIEVNIPERGEPSLIPEDIPIEVIFNDPHIIVVNKPPNMVVYPSAGHERGTLMNALITKTERLASIGAPLRPGIVHRLDKDTSGLIVVAKDDYAYENLFRQFQRREVEKHYLALIYGILKEKEGEIRAVIGRSISDRKKMSTRTKKGKEAITRYEVIKQFNDASLVDVRLITGRTHQIRVHLASIGHPVLGDRTYGKKTVMRIGDKEIRFHRQMLHAYSLRFRHPITGSYVEFIAPLPDDMKNVITELEQVAR